MHVLAEYDKGHANRQGIGAGSCVGFQLLKETRVYVVFRPMQHCFFISFCLIFLAM